MRKLYPNATKSAVTASASETGRPIRDRAPMERASPNTMSEKDSMRDLDKTEDIPRQDANRELSSFWPTSRGLRAYKNSRRSSSGFSTPSGCRTGGPLLSAGSRASYVGPSSVREKRPRGIRSRWTKGHSIAFAKAAFMSLESWPSFCKSYTRSRKKSYVLILLYVTQGDMQSINANPWCWMPFFTSSAIVFTSPLKARATYVAPDARAREIGSTGFSMTPSIGVDFVFIPFSDVGLAWPVVRP